MPFNNHVLKRRSIIIGHALISVTILAGCATGPQHSSTIAQPSDERPNAKSKVAGLPALPAAGSGRGAYYKDDGPGDNPPDGLLDMPDAEPRVEPYSTRGNRSYVVFGKTYAPFTDQRPFKQQGIGSWYGKKFHGQKTSSGELYDMYKMTAAHPTLPIPSYVRVTNLDNGKQVIVRVNDRGPFHANRIIDLSYVAALKLGYLSRGSARLEVERLLPEDIARINANKHEQAVRSAQPAPQTYAPAAVTEKASTTDQRAVAEQVAPAADSTAPSPALSQVSLPAAIAPSSGPANTELTSGFYLQIGVYSSAANAQAARADLLKNWSGNLSAVKVVEQGAAHRVWAGPFSTRADAALAARQLQEAGSVKAVIVQR